MMKAIFIFPSYNDPYLNRFLQPDTIIPSMYNPQTLNRYSYALGNPIRYNDPTGHRACGVGEAISCDGKLYKTDADPYPSIKKTPIIKKGGGGNNACLNGYYSGCNDNENRGANSGDVYNDLPINPTQNLQSHNGLQINSQQERPQTCSGHAVGCKTGGAVLILVTDLFVGLPLAAVVFLSGVATPPAIAAEVLETIFALPVNIFGVYLIKQGIEAEKQ